MGGSNLKTIIHKKKTSSLGLKLQDYGLWTQRQWITRQAHQNLHYSKLKLCREWKWIQNR
jgi:hypothetical protein